MRVKSKTGGTQMRLLRQNTRVFSLQQLCLEKILTGPLLPISHFLTFPWFLIEECSTSLNTKMSYYHFPRHYKVLKSHHLWKWEQAYTLFNIPLPTRTTTDETLTTLFRDYFFTNFVRYKAYTLCMETAVSKVHSVEQVFDYFDAVDHMKKYKYRDKRKHKLVLKQLR